MAEYPRGLAAVYPQYDTNAIILVVGPGQDKLLLHQALLVTSRCLHAACHQEPSVRALELCLPQEDVDHVWRYVHFLYTKTIAAKVPSYTAGVTPREAELTLLCRLYVLGERFQDASFKNAIIDAMVANHREDTEKGQAYSPRGVDTSIIYGGTRAGSPGRKLMLEMHLRGGMGSSQSDHGQYDEGFLTELCVVLLEDRCLGRTRCKEVGQGIPDGAVYHEPLGWLPGGRIWGGEGCLIHARSRGRRKVNDEARKKPSSAGVSVEPPINKQNAGGLWCT